jgi:hypothetical protein
MTTTDTPGIVVANWSDPGFADLPFGLQQTLFALGDPKDPESAVLVITKFSPNAVLPLHSHPSPFCDAVVEGSMKVGDSVHPRGTIRVLQADAEYGPSVAGPEGCTLLEFYAHDSGRPGVFPPEVMTEEFRKEVADFRAQQPGRR